MPLGHVSNTTLETTSYISSHVKYALKIALRLLISFAITASYFLSSSSLASFCFTSSKAPICPLTSSLKLSIKISPQTVFAKSTFGFRLNFSVCWVNHSSGKGVLPNETKYF